jgi:hypothetical protein
MDNGARGGGLAGVTSGATPCGGGLTAVVASDSPHIIRGYTFTSADGLPSFSRIPGFGESLLPDCADSVASPPLRQVGLVAALASSLLQPLQRGQAGYSLKRHDWGPLWWVILPPVSFTRIH